MTLFFFIYPILTDEGQFLLLLILFEIVLILGPKFSKNFPKNVQGESAFLVCRRGPESLFRNKRFMIDEIV